MQRQRRREEREAAHQEQERLDRRCSRAQQQLRAALDTSYLSEKTDAAGNPRILTAQATRTGTEKRRGSVERGCD